MLRWVSKFELKPGTWVFVPTDDEIEFGNVLKKELEGVWSPPSYYYHLQPGGHLSAIRTHSGRVYYLRLDIKNFFGCINRSRVTRNLKKYYPYSVARQYANRSTVKHPDSDPVRYMLPFGFVQSPLIASICFRASKLGRLLGQVNASRDFDVSIYVDDIVVSSDSFDALRKAEISIRLAAEKSGFPINLDKSTSVVDQVTAFNIDMCCDQIKVSEERLGLFREVLRTTDNPYQVEGIINYVKAVNSKQGAEVAGEFGT